MMADGERQPPATRFISCAASSSTVGGLPRCAGRRRPSPPSHRPPAGSSAFLPSLPLLRRTPRREASSWWAWSRSGFWGLDFRVERFSIEELLMEVVTGAMGSLLPKLAELLKDEYNLRKGVKKDIRFLQKELDSMRAALLKVGEVPRDQLDRQVEIWAGEVRDLSYNMEDVVDTFLVRVDGSDPGDGFKGLMKKMVGLFNKGKTHHRIAGAVKEIKEQVQEVAARRDRNKLDGIVARPVAATTIDPRLRALYKEATELVGIYGKRDQELIKLLSCEGDDDDVSKKKLKIVSVVGFGGLGKTTLVRAVYDKIKGNFDCWAFVSVGRNPDVKKVFRDVLIGLDKKYTNINLTKLDESQLIEELREYLENKRYFIVIDDIWDKILWEDIKLAFSNSNNFGSRLITTTRIVSVSQACCSSDSIYEMKSLSDEDSGRLFFKRIFPHGSGCPSEFEQVSRDILKKCGGVPLAIITIASLLASGQHVKPMDEWHALLKSIGRGLTEDASLEEMQRILSFSYYDLPYHLKTCLLYLSIYPEDWSIDRDELIWKWIAESFVQCEKQEISQFDLGKTYFNELINRSMIQPIYDIGGNVFACRVHDMVLDLICSLSSEANFVTVLDGTEDNTSSQSNVRRLSLQSRKKDQQTTPLINSTSISQVRSITIFSPAINRMPALSSFDVLRVLDLRGCNLEESSSQLNYLRDVGNLFHLRYLGLAGTGIRELPAEIGNLQFLQVLDVADNPDLEELPSAVCKLRRLMFVNVDSRCKWLPDELGNLTSLEVLKGISASLNIVQVLGNLARLRELEIYFNGGSLELGEAFVETVCKLHNMQSLNICGNFESLDLLGERWVPPRHLRIFHSSQVEDAFSALPACVKQDPSHLSNFSVLSIGVKDLQQEDVQVLGRLPALSILEIWSIQQTQKLLLVSAGGFRCMITFRLHCGSAAQIVFERGALPRAENVGFDLGVRVAKDDGNGDFDLGLQGNLLSLRDAWVRIYRDGVSVGEAKEAEAAVRHAFHSHPNHPRIRISMEPYIPQDADDGVNQMK